MASLPVMLHAPCLPDQSVAMLPPKLPIPECCIATSFMECGPTPGCGPTQLAVPKGAVCLRDLRVWHRAMPNPSDFPRHMYYLSYSADGDHVHTSVEPEPGAPTAPLSPEPDGARAEVLPTRDPLANSSQLGALRCLNSHTEQQHTPVLWFEEHVFKKNSPR